LWKGELFFLKARRAMRVSANLRNNKTAGSGPLLYYR
jgi:hypothetical protein